MPEVLNQGKFGLRKHPHRGAPPKLSNVNKLLLLLMYYREYRTQFHIGISYSISESRVCEIIKETEGIFIKDSRFNLPGKKSLLKEENHFEVVLVNVMKSPVERPKKHKMNYLGRKKRPTQITQIIADKSGRRILCKAFDKCRKHDFRLFKNSKVYLQEETGCLADTGYYGLLKLHKNSELPEKKSKKHPMTKADKKRNRRKYFILRFNLITAVYNLNLIV